MTTATANPNKPKRQRRNCKRKPKPKNITIFGRRWFHKGPGNTYFSAEIWVDGEMVHKIDYEYGYGEQYKHEAFQWLNRENYVQLEQNQHNHSFEPPWQYCQRKKIQLVATHADVERKKDL